MKLLSGVIFFAVVMIAQMWGVRGFSNEPDEYERECKIMFPRYIVKLKFSNNQ